MCDISTIELSKLIELTESKKVFMEFQSRLQRKCCKIKFYCIRNYLTIYCNIIRIKYMNKEKNCSMANLVAMLSYLYSMNNRNINPDKQSNHIKLQSTLTLQIYYTDGMNKEG